MNEHFLLRRLLAIAIGIFTFINFIQTIVDIFHLENKEYNHHNQYNFEILSQLLTFKYFFNKYMKRRDWFEFHPPHRDRRFHSPL